MDQLIPVCGFLCLYPLLVGALPMYLWMKYGATEPREALPHLRLAYS